MASLLGIIVLSSSLSHGRFSSRHLFHAFTPCLSNATCSSFAMEAPLGFASCCRVHSRKRYEVCHIDVLRSIDENFPMSLPKLTGNLFRAGRALAGLTRDDLANRAGLSRDVLRSWEVSSESIVPAQYQMLCRAIDALEDAGVRFSDSGVYLQRPAPISSVIRSEGAAA